nr:hypothetical protein [Tanacetum cinerariifolium]
MATVGGGACCGWFIGGGEGGVRYGGKVGSGGVRRLARGGGGWASAWVETGRCVGEGGGAAAEMVVVG